MQRQDEVHRTPRPSRAHLAVAELASVGWECLSALLFATAVSPAVVARPWPVLVFVGGLGASACLAPTIHRTGIVSRFLLDISRASAWALALLPVVELTGWLALLGAGAFGLMSSAVRRVLYRHAVDRGRAPTPIELRETLNERLSESTAVVGVAAGHVLMLFLVAFLRTTNDQIRNAWWQVLPWLTLGGTVIFTLAVPRMTATVRLALAQGHAAAPATVRLALDRASRLPSHLALVNFAVWFACASLGSFGFRNLFGWSPTDAGIVVLLGLIFAWGISFYQRTWHLSILAPVVAEIRHAAALPSERPRAGSVGRRLIVDFGLPLVFSCTLSLVSSLGLYRTLVGSYGANVKDVLAVVGSFVVLVVMAGGVIVRAARVLSRPMSALAQAADRVAHGDLEASLPEVGGPDEVAGLRESLERMRRALAKTISELEAERAGLEEKVTARTAALSQALAELKEAQAALLHGEKMALLGQLVAGVAHEINNPLNAIAGSVDSLGERAAEAQKVLAAYQEAEPMLAPEHRERLARLRREVDLDGTLQDLTEIPAVIKRSTARAVRIVRDLLHFSRASSDRVPTDLRAGLDEALSLLGSYLRSGRVTVEKDYGDIPEVMVRADEINQIFLNLLTNALQAVEGKTGAVIRVVTRASTETVEVTVEDNGPGIPEADKLRIFEPFFTTKPVGQGTGLGLSISSQIALRHGGTLSVETPDGGGARFVLRLPLRPSPVPVVGHSRPKTSTRADDAGPASASNPATRGGSIA